MAVSHGYLEREVLKETVRVSNASTITDARYDRVIEASSRWIDERCSDRKCGIIRHFWRESTPVARIYRATDPFVVDVGDFEDPAALTVQVDVAGNGTWTSLDSDQWQAEPVNRFPGDPYNRIVAPEATFPITLASRVKATTRWGYSSAPAPVGTACEILCFAALLGKDVIGALGRNSTFSVSGNSPVDPFILAERFLIPYLPASKPPTQLTATA